MRTKEHRLWYVKCPQFTSDPTTYAKAKYLAHSLDQNQHACFDEPHKVIKIVSISPVAELSSTDETTISDAG